MGLVLGITNNEGISYFFGYLLTLIIIGFVYRKNLLEDAKNFKNDVKGNVKHLIMMYILFIVLMYISNIVLYYLAGNISSNEQSVREMLFSSPLLMGISFSILGPIVEELSFRYTYRNAKTNGIIKFIVYTLIFAAAHISIDLSLVGLLYIIPYTFLSVSIGYSFYKTNNIYTSIIAHIFNNASTIILLLTLGG